MQVLGLLIVLISLVVSTTARSSFGRRLWTVTHGTRGCSVTCDIFNGKCPYPNKCTNIYWLRRQQVSCFKRGKQLHQSRGEVWCGRETNPNWSRGIGRTHSPRRLSSFIRRLTRVDKVAYENGEFVPTRSHGFTRDVGEVMERRRLMNCMGLGSTRYRCRLLSERETCNCECGRDYRRCFKIETGSKCSYIKRTPERVCNGERCIWDWKGYSIKDENMMRDIEGCKNAEVACKRTCSSLPATHTRRPRSSFRI